MRDSIAVNPTLNWLIALGFLFVPAVLNAETPAPAKPNIIVMMCDDVGWSDIGCYGGEVNTPSLNSLASDGVRFTQFYNAARCCPTRASLLTGLYPHQAGIGHMLTPVPGHEGYSDRLTSKSVTLAEVLKGAGYRTYMTGKWHVARAIAPKGDKSGWPLQRGFEKYYGIITGAGSLFDPATLCRQNKFVTVENDPDYKTDDYYFTDALSDNAIKYVKEHKEESPDKPFFMYVAYTAAHWPLHARDRDIAKYKGKYDAGYDAVRKARIARQREMGLIPDDLVPSPTVGNWDAVPNKEWEARNMEVYAAMLDSMDQGIGRIVSSLKETGQYENTLILFLQDNGGCAESGFRADRSPYKEYEPMGPDDLQPKIWPPMQTRDGRAVRTGPDVMAGPADTYLDYGRNWANVSNTPFREYKHYLHEGGIATPLIAHWPKGVAAPMKNKLVDEPGHLIDIMATCVDVAGATYPREVKGAEIRPMEGRSFAPSLQGKTAGRNGPIFWEHESNRAVREGKWKLVAKEDEPWELYDMEADRAEMNNIAAANPDKVKELEGKWQRYAERAQVLPLGVWRTGQEHNVREKRDFKLRQGDELSGGKRPSLDDRGVSITAQLKTVEEGVIVAQGGAQDGYALYLQGGKSHFAHRRDGVLTLVSGAAPAGTSPSLQVVYAPGGEVTLTPSGGQPAAGKINGPFRATPKDGLEIGNDTGAHVGEYEAFPYRGKIETVEIELLESTL